MSNPNLTEHDRLITRVPTDIFISIRRKKLLQILMHEELYKQTVTINEKGGKGYQIPVKSVLACYSGWRYDELSDDGIRSMIDEDPDYYCDNGSQKNKDTNTFIPMIRLHHFIECVDKNGMKKELLLPDEKITFSMSESLAKMMGLSCAGNTFKLSPIKAFNKDRTSYGRSNPPAGRTDGEQNKNETPLAVFIDLLLKCTPDIIPDNELDSHCHEAYLYYCVVIDRKIEVSDEEIEIDVIPIDDDV